MRPPLFHGVNEKLSESMEELCVTKRYFTERNMSLLVSRGALSEKNDDVDPLHPVQFWHFLDRPVVES